MRVLNLNLTDTEGGAAKAATRLMTGVREIGVDASMLVRRKYGDSISVHEAYGGKVVWKGFSSIQAHLDQLPLKLYSKQDRKPWSLNWVSSSISSQVERMQPDVVHLHWVGNGFLSVQEVKKIKHPMLWTMHDSWVLTGGCHIPGECTSYRTGCGCCPQLRSSSLNDLSAINWRRKEKHWTGLDLRVVCPSSWLAEAAKSSPLLQDVQVEVIPNGLDLTRFKPLDKRFCRQLLGLPLEKTLILFGAVSPGIDLNKGGDLLLSALDALSQEVDAEKYALVVFGSASPEQFQDFPFRVFLMGRFHDEYSMAALYCAADVTVVPSRQEAFGQVASESLACGVPVVSFATSGLLDIVDHQVNGYMARPYEPGDMMQGILWVLADSQRYRTLSGNAVEKANSSFDISEVSNRYASIYRQILKSRDTKQ